MRYISYGLLIMVITLPVYSVGRAPAAEPPAAQLIVKFTTAVADPAAADFMRRLSRESGATLSYLRPMSGGAHVFAVTSAQGDIALDETVQRLAKRADVVYVQKEQLARHQ
ncbi:MAG TPA: hypothetical protein VJM76_03565 [Gammaproteobacteria bacterium]|nr:hypothetical protein [Gammaproteobacteria bacterium]